MVVVCVSCEMATCWPVGGETGFFCGQVQETHPGVFSGGVFALCANMIHSWFSPQHFFWGPPIVFSIKSLSPFKVLASWIFSCVWEFQETPSHICCSSMLQILQLLGFILWFGIAATLLGFTLVGQNFSPHESQFICSQFCCSGAPQYPGGASRDSFSVVVGLNSILQLMFPFVRNDRIELQWNVLSRYTEREFNFGCKKICSDIVILISEDSFSDGGQTLRVGL